MSRAATRRTHLGWARVTTAALCALVAGVAAPALAAPTLDELMTDFGFTKDDMQRVRGGELVKTTTKETSDHEIAAVMVFLVKAPVTKLVGSFKIGKGFRYDPQVQSFHEIRGEGTLEDFKALVLQPGGDKEAQRYLNAVPGDALNLSTAEIAALQALKDGGTAGRPQVGEALRRILLARYQAYRSQGLAGIAPYARAKGTQTQAADALRSATEAAKGVQKYAPEFYTLLLKYPEGRPAGLSEHFFWIRYAMNGRPNFTLRQRLAMSIDDAYLVADREYYVGFDYNETQAIGGLLPVADGTAVVYVNRTTTDQLGGFGASAKQAIGRNLLAKQIGEIFEKSRAEIRGD